MFTIRHSMTPILFALSLCCLTAGNVIFWIIHCMIKTYTHKFSLIPLLEETSDQKKSNGNVEVKIGVMAWFKGLVIKTSMTQEYKSWSPRLTLKSTQFDFLTKYSPFSCIIIPGQYI